MKRMLLTGLMALWTGLAAATPLPEWVNSVPPAQMHLGQALDTRSGEWLEPDELVERIRNADRVLLGEQHDNDDHHRLQLWLLQRLHSERPQAGLLLEMLTPAQQPLVDQAYATGSSSAALKEQLQWNPGWPWELYGPVVRWALDEQVPLYAANLDRSEISELYRNPPPLSPRYSEVAVAELRETIARSHCGRIDEPQLGGMLGIQQQRDMRMAEALAAAPAPSLLLAGNFHVRRDLGVPVHVEGEAPVVIMLHEAGKPMPGPEQADYLWLTPAAPEQDHCAQRQSE